MKRFTFLFVLLVVFLTSSTLPYKKEVFQYKVDYIENLDYLIVYDRVYDCYIPTEYQMYIEVVSDWYDIPIWILSRVITRESNWVYDEVNYSNENGSVDIGMMQLNSEYLSYYYWKLNDFNAIDVFNPYDNIDLGAKYLKYLYVQFGSWELAVAAYNCGPTRLRKGLGIPIKTKEYLEYVFQYRLERKEINNEYTTPEFSNRDS